MSKIYEGGNTSHKYKVYYNSYDSEGDSIDSREIIEVYANSFSEAENIARTTLEEGSRDEEFVILDIKKHVNLGNMSKGGMMRKIYEVGIDLGEMGTQTIATFDDMALAMAFLDGYKLADATSNVFIDTVTSDFLESVFEDTYNENELNEMIESVGNAQYILEIMYNSDADDRDEITHNLIQLSKVELLLRNLKP
jgi:hypothetical protein